MSATNSTTNYNLPQFIGTDKPAWLTDFNGAMADIDTAIKAAKDVGDNAQLSANTNASNISTLDGTVGGHTTAISTLQTTVAGNVGSINTITSLMGNGEPTTTDKTVIGAINELNSNVETVSEELSSLLNFTLSATATVTPVTGMNFSGQINTLLNADKSIGKIYGGVRCYGSLTPTADSWNTIATISNANLPAISSAYNIITGYAFELRDGATASNPNLARLVFNTDGTISIQVLIGGSTNLIDVSVPLPPCIYILKDLGD